MKPALGVSITVALFIAIVAAVVAGILEAAKRPDNDLALYNMVKMSTMIHDGHSFVVVTHLHSASLSILHHPDCPKCK